MFVETSVKISEKSDEKRRSYSQHKLSNQQTAYSPRVDRRKAGGGEGGVRGLN